MTKKEGIQCPKCKGKRFMDNIPNGNSTPCSECHGKGVVPNAN